MTRTPLDAYELRTLIEPVEFRKVGDKLQASGYAYVFGKRSQQMIGPRGSFAEVVAPGAGKKTLKEQDVRALFNHDPNLVLGRMGSGTLRMSEDDNGGAYEIDLPDTNAGRDVATLLERGDVIGSSFGFRTIDDAWSEGEDGGLVRTLKEFSLRDVGPVTFPAYLDSTSALKRAAEKRSLPLDEFAERFGQGDFALVLEDPSTPDGDEDRGTDEATDDGRENLTVARERFSHLLF